MFSQWDRDKRDVEGNKGLLNNPENFCSTAKVFVFYDVDTKTFSGFHYYTSTVTSILYMTNSCVSA